MFQTVVQVVLDVCKLMLEVYEKKPFDGRPPIHLSILQIVITLTLNEAIKLNFLQNAGNLFYHN